MKAILLIAAAITLSQSTFAQSLSKEDLRKQIFESQPSCDQAVFTNDAYFVSSLKASSRIVRVTSLVNPTQVFDVIAKDRVVSTKILNETLYVLTETTIEAWTIADQKQIFAFVSHPNIANATSWRQKATGFVVKGDNIVISHGVFGFSVLNPRLAVFTKTIAMPTISSAQDIDLLNNETAIVAVDNDDEAQFRGLYLIDLNTFTITKQIKIDNALPSGINVLDNNRLMVIYFNAVWKFDLNAAVNSSQAQPNRRAWKFPGLFLTDMNGKVAFDQKNLYACFKTMNEETGARKLVPLAFDLETLKLN